MVPKGIIINITGNEDLGLFEINEASQIITEAADPDANIIWGTSVDDTLDNDTVRITVIATGFGGKRKSTGSGAGRKQIQQCCPPEHGNCGSGSSEIRENTPTDCSHG